MSRTLSGFILGLVALIALVASAANSQNSALSYTLLGVAALAVLAIVALVNRAVAAPVGGHGATPAKPIFNRTTKGAALGVFALACLLGSAANAQNALASQILLGLAVLAVVGIFVLVNRGVLTPPAPREESDVEIKVTGEWDKWPQALGASLVGLVALLSWVGLFVALHYGYGTWIAFPAVGMVVIWLGVISLYASGVTDKSH